MCETCTLSTKCGGNRHRTCWASDTSVPPQWRGWLQAGRRFALEPIGSKHRSSSWWFRPIRKILESKWESSPNRGEHKKYLKPPPSFALGSTNQDDFFFRVGFPLPLQEVLHAKLPAISAGGRAFSKAL